VVTRHDDGNDAGVEMDGHPMEAGQIHLNDDGGTHRIRVGVVNRMTLAAGPLAVSEAGIAT